MLYRTSLILYNKSHVPAIIEFAKTDERSLGRIAHEIITDMSNKTPEVLKAQIQEICRSLQEGAPSINNPNDASAVNNLKACATFAKRFPKEIPQDRNFVQAMTSYALYSSPPGAAKYAVSIIMAASEKKEMIAKDLVHRCVKDFEYGKDGFLSRLVALSQLWLLAPTEMDQDSDAVVDIAIKEILLQVRSPPSESTDDYVWEENPGVECAAKCWALKIIVNRLRSHPNQSTLSEIAEPIYALLKKLISSEGELISAGSTPPSHKPHLRLIAARLFLKLCLSKPHEALLDNLAFNKLAEVAQDPLFQVRASFMQRLKKYLTHNKIPPRFFTIPFLLAFEPDSIFKSETAAWIKNRALFLSNLKPQVPTTPANGSKTPVIATKASTVLEAVFARLISLLAHHPDYDSSPSDMVDFSRYIVFYLSNVANEENVSLIYHIAQRIKGCQDAVAATVLQNAKADKADDELTQNDWDERLYTLSDLAQVTIRAYEEAHNWTIQTLPTITRLSLPRTLYTEIKDHEAAMSIAEKIYLSQVEEVKEGAEREIRRAKAFTTHGRKRRSEGGDGTIERGAKKSKPLPVRNPRPRLSKPSAAGTSKRKTVAATKKSTKWNPNDNDDVDEDSTRETVSRTSEVPAGERRRSGRRSGVETKYAERDDSEDDKEMEEMNREEQDEEGAGSNEEEQEQAEADEEVEEEDEGNATPSRPHSESGSDEEPAHEEEEEKEDPLSPPKSRSSPRSTRMKAKSESKTSPKSKARGKVNSKHPPTTKQTKSPIQKLTARANANTKPKPNPTPPSAITTKVKTTNMKKRTSSTTVTRSTRSTRSKPAPLSPLSGDDEDEGENKENGNEMQIDEKENEGGNDDDDDDNIGNAIDERREEKAKGREEMKIDMDMEVAESELSELPNSEEDEEEEG